MGAHADAGAIAALLLFYELLPGIVLGALVSALAPRLIYGRPLLHSCLAALSLPVAAWLQFSILDLVGIAMIIPVGVLAWMALLLVLHGLAGPVSLARGLRLRQMCALTGLALLPLVALRV